MKKLIVFPFVLILFSCNNNKSNPSTVDNPSVTNSENSDIIVTDNTTSASLVYDVDGISISNNAGILVTKDKDKLKSDAPYLCMLTSNAAKHNNEYLTINFLLATKPGVYPIVGSSLNRGPNDNSEMYGGLLGGKPAITGNNVTITECKDLGDNNQGGHKWSISGYWEGITIPAAKIMLLDKSNNHPKDVKLGKGSFANLVFDDNWEEILEKGLEQMNKNK